MHLKASSTTHLIIISLAMESEKRVNFTLVSISEEEFQTAESNHLSAKDIRVLYLIETEIHQKDQQIYVRSGVRYLNGEADVCKCIIGIRFSIEEFHSVISIDEDNKIIKFSTNLMPTLLSITYGALRGALYERVKNTPMESFPLPLISMPQLEKFNHFRVEG